MSGHIDRTFTQVFSGKVAIRRRRSVVLCSLAAALVLAAASVPSVATEESLGEVADDSAEVVLNSHAQRAADPTADRDADKLGRTAHVPGFGGSYIDGDTLHIWSTQPDQVDKAEVVADILGSMDVTNVVTHKADFTFRELKEWKDALLDIAAFDGLVWIGIFEDENRVAVGLEGVESRSTELMREIERIGVPTDAVKIYESAPAEFDLRQQRRPLVGGLQIAYNTAQGWICTLGFVARIGTMNGFVTNTHCTASPFETGTSTVYWQPMFDWADLSQNVAGYEAIDREPFPCEFQGVTYRCRWADAAFAEAWPGVTLDRGRIARPATGSHNWNGTNTYRITSVEMGDPTGLVNKVGRTTGLTSGAVTQNCINFLFHWHGVPYVLLCQDLATYASDSGDSGAPVLGVTNSPSGGDVRLMGIHSGRVTIDGTSYARFSAYSNITFDLGGSGAMSACATSFAC